MRGPLPCHRIGSVVDFAQKLIRWQRRHGRHGLPWQRTRDPYRIWLSEIMLQQTQVAAVVPYYERFLARFPDIGALAAATEDEVLRLWSGLGYYARGRNLHAAREDLAAAGLPGHRSKESRNCRASGAPRRPPSPSSPSAAAPRSSMATSSACLRAASASRASGRNGSSPRSCCRRAPSRPTRRRSWTWAQRSARARARPAGVARSRRTAWRCARAASPNCRRRASASRCRCGARPGWCCSIRARCCSSAVRAPASGAVCGFFPKGRRSDSNRSAGRIFPWKFPGRRKCR